jgi:peptidoglycan-N-acetylglucosamine deacetylase
VLTFDDGPHPTRTPAILKALKERSMKAVFFVLGQNAKRYPGLIKEILADGHQIGAHGYSHAQLTKISPQACTKELADTEKALLACKTKVSYFRPPYGSYNASLQKQLAQRGWQMVMWSVDTMDWSAAHRPRLISCLLAGIKPGRIVLMHDIQANTAARIGAILDAIKNAGYGTMLLPPPPQPDADATQLSQDR